MPDSVSPEVPIKKEGVTTKSWQEIRNNYLNSSYSEIYEAAMDRFKIWESGPREPIDQGAWNRDIQQQIDRAKQLVGKTRHAAKIIEGNNKVTAVGVELPSFGVKDATRIYLGIDPRKSTDVFEALLDELEGSGVLKDINVAVNLEPLEDRVITGNMIIIYDPLSRIEVLNQVLRAYHNAKASNPDLFLLSDRQKADVMRWKLRCFHATVDANMSFVEQPVHRGGNTFDEVDRLGIQKAFSMGAGVGKLKDEQWLEKTKKTGNVWTQEDQKKISLGQLKSGETMHFERKLSAPALVERGTVTVNT